MKEEFKKLTLLTFHQDRKKVTAMLQELGVVHLELDTSFRNENLEELEHQKNQFTKTIETISEHIGNVQSDTASSLELSTQEVINEVTLLRQHKETNLQTKETLHKDGLRRAPWGDFEFDRIQQFEKNGISIQFFIAEKKEFQRYDFREIVHEVIHTGPDQIYFVVISTGEPITLPFEIVQMPDNSLSEIAAKQNELDKSNKEIDEKIQVLKDYLAPLSNDLKKLENDMALLLANGSYQEYGEGSILYMTGWVPVRLAKKLKETLETQKLTYAIEDPSPEDQVPVLLKNRKYPKLFETITRIFELPNYYEMDLTPFIAVFYPILFAYCLGDAGYGLLLLLAATIGWFTFLKTQRQIAVLGLILGGFTTVMGIVKSGSIFGLPTTVNDTNVVFQYLGQFVIVPDDRSFVFNAFNVALMIGVVQILVGIILSIVNRVQFKSTLEAVPQLGKLLIVVSLIWIFLADMQNVAILSAFPMTRKVMLLAGVVLVLFFHDMKTPVLARAASGILPLFFILTGILGDILSYVRLFALGVASAVLGLVVNQIGMQIIGNSWWGIPIGLVFLLFGHSLNFGIALLGAFVHPLRLTFVEFYNNAEFKGGGVDYKPFKKNL